MNNESFVCVNCGIEMEGSTYREFLDNWKRPPLCQCRARCSSDTFSIWRRKLVGRLEVKVAPDPEDGDCLRVPGADRYCVHRDGRLTFGRITPLVVRQLPGKLPLVVDVRRDGGGRTVLVVCRTVARAFCPEFKDEHHIGYRDGDHCNCAATNLVFLTQKEYRQTLRLPQAELSEIDLRYIRQCGRSPRWIARAFRLDAEEVTALLDVAKHERPTT